jgi:hypothetical protein
LAGESIKEDVYKKFPWAGATEPVSKDAGELIVNGTWMPALSYTGMDGMPAGINAGNVLRTQTTVKLSLRTPPSVEPKDVATKFEEILTANPPYNAKISFTLDKAQVRKHAHTHRTRTRTHSHWMDELRSLAARHNEQYNVRQACAAVPGCRRFTPFCLPLLFALCAFFVLSYVFPLRAEGLAGTEACSLVEQCARDGLAAVLQGERHVHGRRRYGTPHSAAGFLSF